MRRWRGAARIAPVAHEHDAHDAHDEDASQQVGVGSLNYEELPGLEHVCLEDSFVREVAQDGGTLRFVLTAALLRGHPYYTNPRSNERHCFRPATLTFREAQVKWRARSNARFVDSEGAVDLGNIDTFVAPAEGGYHIEGDFGVLDIVRARAPVFIVVGESPGPRTYRRGALRRWVRTGSGMATPGDDHAHDHAHAHPPDADPHGQDEHGHDHHAHDHHAHTPK
jgi:hypothetical protein